MLKGTTHFESASHLRLFYTMIMLIELACPNCKNSIDPRDHGKHVTCDACGSQFILDGHFCANCHAYYSEERGFCQECGSAMNRVCRKCNTPNWAGDEYCQKCGAALDIFELLHQQNQHKTADRLIEQQESARELKAKEAAASEKRMADLVNIERERQIKLAQRRQVQKQKDKQLFIIVGAVLLFAILLIGFTLLLTS